MQDTTHILIVEDMTTDYELAKREIRKTIPNCQFERVVEQTSFLNALLQFQPDVIVSDYKLPIFDGGRVLSLVQEHSPHIPVIIWTGTMSEETAVDSMKMGASNYVLKDNIKRLGPAVIHALKERRLHLDHEQAETKIRESEEKYRLLFEHNPLPMWIYDLETLAFLKVNESAIEHYGYSEDEYRSMTLKDIRPANDVPALLQNVSNVITGSTHTDRAGVWRHLKKDGTLIFVEIISHPLEFEGRQAELVLANDVTERIQAESQIKDLLSLNEKMLNRSPLGILTYTMNGTCIFANENAASIVGTDVEALRTQNFRMIDSWKRSGLYALVEQAISTRMAVSADIHHISTFGREVWMSAHCVSFFSNDEEHILLSLLDITERKKAEQELRDSEERFRQLANNLEEVFWITDARSGDELYISPAAEKIWGYSNESMRQDPRLFYNSILPEDQPAVLKNIEKQRHGENTDMEYRIVHPDGSIHWVWDRAFPIFDENGVEVRLAGIAADITDRKQAEAETQRHLAELQALYENGLAIGQLLDPHEIGERVINTFARYLSWHHVTIRSRKGDSNELELMAFNLPGLTNEEKPTWEPVFRNLIRTIGDGISGEVVRTGIPIRTGNVRAHPEYVNTYEGIRSGLYMPLKIGERVIGVISVESESPDAFTEQDERLLATFANQAAVAFENARLYQAAQQELFERYRAQDALSASEVHYRELADSITDILFEVDHNLRFTHWNKATEILSGIPANEAIGRSIQELFGDSAEEFRQMEIYKNVFAERQSRTFETELFFNGQKQDLEVNAYPSARGVSVVAKDISKRKRSETLMQKRFELIEYTAHHSLNEVMRRVIDELSQLTDSHIGFLDTIGEDEVTVNRRTWSSETLGDSRQSEDVGLQYPFDPSGTLADAIRLRQSVIRNGQESHPGEWDNLPGLKAEVFREMVIPIIRNDKIVAAIGVGNKADDYTKYDLETAEWFADFAWDITERKQMETILMEERIQLAKRVDDRTADLSRANSNLARALRVKDEFLANMSHELRTPLNAILGLSESLSEQIAGPLNEKQQRYLTTINESGHHLLSLINDILDLAKIEAGQITLEINPVNVASVCETSLRMIKQLAQKKNQDVSFTMNMESGLILADERRLKQIIVNLLSNAVKFTPEGGRLGLDVYGDRAAERVIITAWDEGIGISEENLNRLFSPFVQLNSGLAREAAGTGLGLALVSQMVRMHGGSVSVESQVGKGSRFSVHLPWGEVQPQSVSRKRYTSELSSIDPRAANRPTILLVEDTHEVVMMLADYLEVAGYHVITAQDGIEGLEQAKRTRPDLILMDIQMPRMNGIETTQRLRADPLFKHTPIIALTALAMPNDRQRCLDAGMNEYISKPVNLRSLVDIIQSNLRVGEDNKVK